MSGQNYVVNYDINVLSADAVSSINSFVTATKKLTGAATNFNKLNNQINNINNRFKALAGKAPVIQIKTSDAERKLDRLIGKLNRISKMSKGLNIPINVNETQRVSGGRSSNRRTTVVSGRPKNMGSIRYNALGQTLIDTGGVGAIDLLKGMGIAYGISGIGSLMSGVVKDSAEYNNLIQTTRNILKTHDFGADFAGRFHEMERTIRNVGVETKFTAPQVADASKFLAMAGFDIDAINKSIRPISDIALVGDTDLGETADVVTNIMTGYGISPDRIRQAADVMTMTFTKSNTTLMELAEAYKYSASLLSINGTSFEEATAAIGILGDAGIKGSQAGTTMRTLALNIAKPTKGQREMWESLGIDRYDKNGQLRPLVEIFQDLNKQNLGLAQFGALFHKTAAQGAASLAANVDKWNEIIKLNFLSDGVVADLANAKKNTIQGLWAQVTSAFTEAGMLAFEEIEQPIKDMMNTAVGWLTSDVGKQTVRDFAMDVWDIVKVVAEFSKTLFGLYQTFKPFIKVWLEWQLKLSAILIPLRAVRSLLNFGKYVLTGARAIGTLSNSFGLLSGGILKSIASLEIFHGMVGGHGMKFWGKAFLAKNRWLLDMNPLAMLRGGGGIAGAIAGGIIGGNLSDGNAMGSIIGTLGGGLLGTGIGNYLPGILKWLMNFKHLLAVGLPVAAGVAVYAIAKHIDSLNDAVEANQEFMKVSQSLNGIDYSSLASVTDKYLQIVYDKQLTANQALAKYIELRKEELGLLANQTAHEDHTPFKDIEKYKSSFANVLKPFGTFSFGSQWYSMLNNEGLKEDLWVTHKPMSSTFNGVEFPWHAFSGNGKRALESVAGARYLYTLGQSLAEGTETKKIVDNFRQNFLSAATLGDFNAVQANLDNKLRDLYNSIIPGSEHWGLDVIGNNTLATNQKGYHYVTAQIKAIQDAFRPNGQTDIWRQILVLSDQGQQIPDKIITDFLLKSGIGIFDSAKFGHYTEPDWLNQFGFYNNQWNPMNFDGTHLTAEQAKKHHLMSYNQLVDVVRHSAPELQNIFDGVVKNDALWRPDSILGLEAGKSKKMLNGIEYTWDGKNWIPNKLATSQKPLTNAEMEAQLKGVPNLNTTSGDGSGTGGYSNHYKSTTAVPKQIIVKIENLMNVESIDMTNPDNAAVVENLKDQMAQVLIDVVADFNASNLT